MEIFLSHLLGTTNIPTYLAGFILAGIGALISLRVHANSRDKSSLNTPKEFSWRFLVLDNITRLFTGFLITFIAFRFTNEFLGTTFTMWTAFLIGLLFDQVAGILGKIESIARK